MRVHKSDGDPHDEIVRLEAHIEELAAKIENCRKFILASRIAMAGRRHCLRRDAPRRNPVRSGRDGGRGHGGTRRHCRVGFKLQHRKGSGEGIGSG